MSIVLFFRTDTRKGDSVLTENQIENILDELNDSGLTPKQQNFIMEYLKDSERNCTRAAMNAGYSNKTAMNASHWLNKKHDKYNAKMADIIKKISDEIKSEKIMSADEVLERLSKIGRGQEKETVLMFVEKGVQAPVEMNVSSSSQLKALDQLAKAFGMYQQQLNVDVSVPVFVGEDDIEE